MTNKKLGTLRVYVFYKSNKHNKIVSSFIINSLLPLYFNTTKYLEKMFLQYHSIYILLESTLVIIL